MIDVIPSALFEKLHACSLLENACELVVKLNGVRLALNTLKDYPHQKDIIIPCCRIIQCTLEKGHCNNKVTDKLKLAKELMTQ